MESGIIEPLPRCGETAQAQPRTLRRWLPYAGMTRIRFKGFSRRSSQCKAHPQPDLTIRRRPGGVKNPVAAAVDGGRVIRLGCASTPRFLTGTAMARVHANGIDIEYESFGRESDPALLLIMGFGAQLTLWPRAFCEGLAGRGFRVIRFDNRDAGKSTRLTDKGVPDVPRLLAQMAAGEPVAAPYLLSDMAADAVGLLDALGIERAHIVGASMGGMIAQLVAAEHPRRTKSLVSIMSTTGRRDLPQPKPEAMV